MTGAFRAAFSSCIVVPLLVIMVTYSYFYSILSRRQTRCWAGIGPVISLTPLQSHHSLIHHSETELQGRRYEQNTFIRVYIPDFP